MSTTAADRIKNFLANYERAQGVHPEEVYSMHSIPDGEPGQILVSDLRALVADAERVARMLPVVTAAQEAVEVWQSGAASVRMSHTLRALGDAVGVFNKAEWE